MPWCLDAQVSVLGQGLLPCLFRKLPIGESLQTPSHAAKQELLMIRAGWLPKQVEIFNAQLPYCSPSELFNFDPHRCRLHRSFLLYSLNRLLQLTSLIRNELTPCSMDAL